MKNGFTLIEFLIVLTIIGILIAISVPSFQATKIVKRLNNTNLTSCIAGYVFTNTQPPKQIIDSEGKGIPCSSNFSN